MQERSFLRFGLRITGEVQGVFYRAWFVEQARGLGLEGWVRNRADGSVEAVVRGSAEAVEAIIAKAREGSPASRVVEVVVGYDPWPQEELNGFEKRPTA